MLRTNHPSSFGTSPCSVCSNFVSGTIGSARKVTLTQRGGRLRCEGIGLEELLEGYGRECRLVDEEVSVPRARVGEVRVTGGVGNDIATPLPRATWMLEHGEQEQVLEPHH